MEFEWDKFKAAANLNKHGISFEEHREIIIGHSQNNRLMLVSFTERPNAIRIISAHLATRIERENYEQNDF
jgi:uncharacterized protein